MDAPTPLRPDEEVAGGYISVTMGGQAKRLPVLPIVRNRDWKRQFDEMIAELGMNAESDDFDEIVRALSDSIEKMLDLLIAYDETAALGGREWMEQHASDGEVYEAFKRVKDAAYPFGFDLMARVLGEVRMNMARLAAGSKSMSFSPPNTGGRRRRSSTASPTSNSTPLSMPRSSGPTSATSSSSTASPLR